MSKRSEGKTSGNWASPPTTTNAQGRPLTGRVIFGMLTGEGPETTTNQDPTAKERRR